MCNWISRDIFSFHSLSSESSAPLFSMHNAIGPSEEVTRKMHILHTLYAFSVSIVVVERSAPAAVSLPGESEGKLRQTSKSPVYGFRLHFCCCC